MAAGALGTPAAAAGNAPLVIVYGDSIAAGTALRESERSQVWVQRVAELARARLRLVNESKGGRWTNSLGEFDAMLARRPRADILVVALGTNDSADLSGDAVGHAVRNLAAMVERARRAYGRRLAVLIVAPPNMRKDALLRTRPIGERREARLQELRAAFEHLAKQLGCQFISLYGVVPPASLASDGMHPDGAGNERIARIVLPKLLAMAASREALAHE